MSLWLIVCVWFPAITAASMRDNVYGTIHSVLTGIYILTNRTHRYVAWGGGTRFRHLKKNDISYELRWSLKSTILAFKPDSVVRLSRPLKLQIMIFANTRHGILTVRGMIACGPGNRQSGHHVYAGTVQAVAVTNGAETDISWLLVTCWYSGLRRNHCSSITDDWLLHPSVTAETRYGPVLSIVDHAF
jgi:hypothetical protein